jgi:heme/copper-type cytochrome/quinol oxidase subunit 2
MLFTPAEALFLETLYPKAIWLQAAPGFPEHRIANIFKPLATPAESEYNIALFVLAITAVIFLVVISLLIYTHVSAASGGAGPRAGPRAGPNKR